MLPYRGGVLQRIMTSRAALLQGGRTGIANNELRSVEVCRLQCRSEQVDGVQEVHYPPDCIWQPAGPMCHPRTAVAAASLGQAIYAVGGQVPLSLHHLPASSTSFSLLQGRSLAQLPLVDYLQTACRKRPELHCTCRMQPRADVCLLGCACVPYAQLALEDACSC